MLSTVKIGGERKRSFAAYLTGNEPGRLGDYYLSRDGEHREHAGQWYGGGAAALALHGEVRRADLLAVWDGRAPGTTLELVKRSQRGEHYAGIDCTFGAPKSVSVVWALSDAAHREEIEAVQTRAVEVALDHIEAEAPLVRRRVKGQMRHERAGGLVVSRFRHHTSRVSGQRWAEGAVPDPHLHDHCTIANMALRRTGAEAKNGWWGAVEHRELMILAAEAGAVYRAELAAGLMELGYSIRRDGRFFAVEGVPENVCKEFSKRADEIKAAHALFKAEHGREPTDEEERSLAVRTRGQKQPEQAPAFDHWRATATALGFVAEGVPELRHTPRNVSKDARAVSHEIFRELGSVAGEFSLTHEKAVVTENELRAAIAEAAQGRLRGSDVSSLFMYADWSNTFVALPGGNVTTVAMIELERGVLLRGVEMARTGGERLDKRIVREAIDGADVRLSKEQVKAVKRLSSCRRLGLVTAPAGSGKGVVLGVMAEAHRRSGRRVVALAASGETAQRLGEEIKADETRTVDSFIHRARTRGEVGDAHTVLIVDEAALMETKRWKGLLDAAGGAIVIAAGDDKQLSSIEAGGVWGVLVREVGSAELEENYRARDPDIADAWSFLREGASARALAEFENRGLVEICADRKEAVIRSVERWDEDRRKGLEEGKGLEQYLLLTDASNYEVDELNGLAQAKRRLAGELGAGGVGVSFHDKKTGYQRDEVIRPGDRIVFERRFVPVNDAGRKLKRVENGAVGEVERVDPGRGVVVRTGGREVTVPGEDVDALRLGYAQHVYSAQGRTVERSYVLAGSWQTDRERAYVGISRSRGASVVVSDYSSLGVEKGRREEALAVLSARCGISRKKEPALALVERVGQLVERARGVAVEGRELAGWSRDVPDRGRDLEPGR